ncbi:MAG: FAD-dependent oxidoreductase [Isosphaeraceae bacterium]|nr:FAD-dependent oxidoreductase [Isosphaeraceae bacterium]
MKAAGIRARAVVIGAGIVGAACARALAIDGFRVTLLDHRPVGSGSTAAGMGHVVVMDDSEAQFQLCRRSRELWEELAPQLPAAVEYDHAGTIWVAADDEELREVDRKACFYAERGYEARVLDPAELRRKEPNLRPGLAGGLFVPGDRVLYPPSAARALLDLAPDVEIQIGAPVSHLESAAAVRLDGRRFEADLVVVAAGADAPRLVEGSPIRPRKGHLVITDRYPGFVNSQLIELGYLKSAHGSEAESVAFNVQPRPTGQLLIGSSRKFDDLDPTVEPRTLERMLARAIEYIPGLKGLQAIRSWTGFRAATPDSLPIIGPIPGLPGVFLAAGHEGLGITTSLATAELVADLALGRPPAIDPAPYRACREHADSSHG